ncbi:Tetrahydromethanopterin S-methyltransferase subunit A 2 [Bienertia sinuspersici]
MVLKCSSATTLEVAQGGTHVRGGPEKFDRWMKESVGEIVKNLREAPLFVHVYGGGGPDTRLKAERAVAEDWSHLKGKWVKGEEPSPEGIILVEELKEDDVEILEEDEGQSGDCTKAWGVLIQGKGEDGGVACYLLKTSRVGCGNLGLFCTHYCLVRVKNFRETAQSQLTSCWLV